MNLPSKILIIVWWISRNFIPTMANLNFRRLTASEICSRCCKGVETTEHIFWEYLVSIETWRSVGLQWVLMSTTPNWFDWLTWVFNNCSNLQCRIFCCSLWTLWNARNKAVHENRVPSSQDIFVSISSYIAELDGLAEKGVLKRTTKPIWPAPVGIALKLILMLRVIGVVSDLVSFRNVVFRVRRPVSVNINLFLAFIHCYFYLIKAQFFYFKKKRTSN